MGDVGKSHISEPIRKALDNSGSEERRRRVLDIADRGNESYPAPRPQKPLPVKRT
jgi:hypothetical protein